MRQVLGNQKQGLLFIVSGPSGSGKTTLVQRLLAEFSCVKKSVSYTTRKRRPTELDGGDYCFISPLEFASKKAAGDFLETVSLFSFEYGTCRRQVEATLALGFHLVLVIDTIGAAHILEKMPAISIFIHPPSLQELAHRLERRGTEDRESIEERCQRAVQEIKGAPAYTYQVVNDQLEVAYQVLRSIIIAEEHRTEHAKPYH